MTVSNAVAVGSGDIPYSTEIDHTLFSGNAGGSWPAILSIFTNQFTVHSNTFKSLGVPIQVSLPGQYQGNWNCFTNSPTIYFVWASGYHTLAEWQAQGNDLNLGTDLSALAPVPYKPSVPDYSSVLNAVGAVKVQGKVTVRGGISVADGQYDGSAAGLSNYPAAMIAAGTAPINITGSAAGGNSFTNTWTVNGPMAVGTGTNYVCSSGTATIGITGVANNPTSTEPYGQLTIVATGTVTLTNLASIRMSDGLTSRTVTNGTSCVIGMDVLPGVRTNAAILQIP
jgi:hypothetical protein